MTPAPGAAPRFDVIVVGTGLIGLASTAAAADRGCRTLLVADVRRGEASPAAAGMLAPSVERAGGTAQQFAVAARERYPAYLAWLSERTGVAVPLNRLGILELALAEGEVAALQARLAPPSRWLEHGELAGLEPGLGHAFGAAFHPDDGAVNNLVLLRALKAVIGRERRVQVTSDAAVAVTFDRAGVTVETREGARHQGAQLVLAAGAWAPLIAGLPRPLPVEPVRGQMMSLAASPVRRVAYGAGGYIVPRGDGRTLVGSTMERVAFDPGTTPEAMAHIRRVGETICPALAGARMLLGWAGLRPVTPDLLPILGRDPERPALVYACGHSRNGVLLAPLTGDCVGALVAGEAPPFDLTPFGVERFGGAASRRG